MLSINNNGISISSTRKCSHTSISCGCIFCDFGQNYLYHPTILIIQGLTLNITDIKVLSVVDTNFFHVICCLFLWQQQPSSFCPSTILVTSHSSIHPLTSLFHVQISLLHVDLFPRLVSSLLLCPCYNMHFPTNILYITLISIRFETNYFGILFSTYL